MSLGEGLKIPYSTNSSYRPFSIALDLFFMVRFRFIGLCLEMVLVFTYLDTVLFLDISVKYTVELVPLHYVYCVACYQTIAVGYVRSVAYVLHSFILVLSTYNTPEKGESILYITLFTYILANQALVFQIFKLLILSWCNLTSTFAYCNDKRHKQNFV